MAQPALTLPALAGDLAAYSLAREAKDAYLLPRLRELVAWHADRCEPYARFLRSLGPLPEFGSVEDVPYLPVSVFKSHELRSIGLDDGARVVTSSSTSGGAPSKIYLDRDTAALQRVSVHRILADYIGAEPRPYIVFDDRETASGRGPLAARGAALMSLMGFASKFFFVMRTNPETGRLELDRDAFAKALDAAADAGAFLAYGFTYILWQAHEALADGPMLAREFSATSSFLLHSGGWKQLQARAVDRSVLAERVAGCWGLPVSNVIDFYGLAEQVGVLYPDCEAGHKHPPYFADIVIRDPATLAPLGPGEPGLIQLVSLLGRGGPSHSVITEDRGELCVARDTCPCGRKGQAFRLLGRVAQAETRGCGDVYAQGT